MYFTVYRRFGKRKTQAVTRGKFFVRSIHVVNVVIYFDPRAEFCFIFFTILFAFTHLIDVSNGTRFGQTAPLSISTTD